MVNVQFREPLYNISDTNHKTMRSNYLKGIMSQTSGMQIFHEWTTDYHRSFGKYSRRRRSFIMSLAVLLLVASRVRLPELFPTPCFVYGSFSFWTTCPFSPGIYSTRENTFLKVFGSVHRIVDLLANEKEEQNFANKRASVPIFLLLPHFCSTMAFKRFSRNNETLQKCIHSGVERISYLRIKTWRSEKEWCLSTR